MSHFNRTRRATFWRACQDSTIKGDVYKMATSDEMIQTLIYDIKAVIYTVSEDQLQHVCRTVGIPMDKSNPGRISSVRAMEKYISVISQEEEAEKYLEVMLAVLKTQVVTMELSSTQQGHDVPTIQNR